MLATNSPVVKTMIRWWSAKNKTTIAVAQQYTQKYICRNVGGDHVDRVERHVFLTRFSCRRTRSLRTCSCPSNSGKDCNFLMGLPYHWLSHLSEGKAGGQCLEDSAWRTVPGGQCLEDSTWKTVPGGQCLEDSAWRTVPGGQCLEDSAWRTVPGGQCLEDSAWRTVPGRQCLEDSAWRTVPGGQCLEDSAWRTVPGGQWCLFYAMITHTYDIFIQSFFWMLFPPVTKEDNVWRHNFVYKSGKWKCICYTAVVVDAGVIIINSIFLPL